VKATCSERSLVLLLRLFVNYQVKLDSHRRFLKGVPAVNDKRVRVRYLRISPQGILDEDETDLTVKTRLSLVLYSETFYT
jgi:hypothetical protein